MKKTKVFVKQDELKPVPVEVLAESVRAISDGVKKLRASNLNDKALVLLIQHASPAVIYGYKRNPITAQQVRAVLEGMESLEREYLKPKKTGEPL